MNSNQFAIAMQILGIFFSLTVVPLGWPFVLAMYGIWTATNIICWQTIGRDF